MYFQDSQSLAARAEGERAEAVECAKAAAPYVHPKAAPTSPPTPVQEAVDYSVLSDSELDQRRSAPKCMREPMVVAKVAAAVEIATDR